MFTSCFRPWLKNVACLSPLLSVCRTAIAPAKCKSQSRDLARVFFRVIYLVADQSKSIWSSSQIWLAISIWSDLYSNFRQLPRTDEFPVISRGQRLSIYLFDFIWVSYRWNKRNPCSSILDLQIHSELLDEHVRVALSKLQRFRKRLSLFVSLFRSHWRRKRPSLSSPTPYS